MAVKNILIVDDDICTVRLVEAALKNNGFNVIHADSGEKALDLLGSNTVHVILMDIVLPGIDGLETLRRIRLHPFYQHLPVLMLTCRNSEFDTVVGLELGADDYIGKPIRYHELIARVRTVLRRAEQSGSCTSGKIVLGDLVINLTLRTVLINKQEVRLSFKEFELLAMLTKNPGRVFTRDEILDTVWQDEYSLETRTVDVHIRRIRKKIEEISPNTIFIETIRNVGYRVVSPSGFQPAQRPVV